MNLIPVARPSLGPEELAAVGRVFDSRWLGLGAVTAEFEDRLSAMVGARPVVATNTGTTAIELALRTIGIGPGDDVITPAMTFVATAQAIAATGATPILCDIDPVSLNATAETLEQARTPRTRAVVPVDYRGLPVNVAQITRWASGHGIRVVIDAAHSFGSKLDDGALVGSTGDITCFSFDPIKNITCGEGGAIVFSSEKECDTAAKLRVLGIDSTAWSRLEAKRPWEYDVRGPGFRFHMPNFAAAIGLAQLDRLDEFRATKQATLGQYIRELKGRTDFTVADFPVDRCMPFLAVLTTEHRSELMDHLREHGVGSGVQYQPLSAFTAFSRCGQAKLPVTESFADSLVTIPILNDQTREETDTVVQAVMSFDPRGSQVQ